MSSCDVDRIILHIADIRSDAEKPLLNFSLNEDLCLYDIIPAIALYRVTDDASLRGFHQRVLSKDTSALVMFKI